jgi:hypothetical protein
VTMGEYFTLRDLLVQRNTNKPTVGSRDKLCSKCRERYFERTSMDANICFDDLVDSTISACDNSRMCRPLLMLVVRDCLATETDASLFTYQCDLRSNDFDNVGLNILNDLKHEQNRVRNAAQNLHRLLKYKNAKRSLDAFFTMVHRTKTRTRRSFILNIIHMSFHGASSETDFDSIMRAMNSGVTLFMEASRGFIIKSLDDLNTLRGVEPRIKYNQIARLFPSVPIIALKYVQANGVNREFEISPSNRLMHAINDQDVAYIKNELKLSTNLNHLIKFHLEDNSIFKHLFKTIYRDGKWCLKNIVAHVTKLELVSKHLLPNFALSETDESFIHEQVNSLSVQFKFMATTTLTKSTVQNFSDMSEHLVQNYVLDLFLVYFQVSKIKYRLSDLSFMSTIKFTVYETITDETISFIYNERTNVCKVTKIKNANRFNIWFDCGYFMKKSAFDLDDWYRKTLSMVCGTNKLLYDEYAQEVDEVIQKLHHKNIIKNEMLFSELMMLNAPLASRTEFTIEGDIFVMFYSGILTNVHDELFYTVSSFYDRINLDRHATRKVEDTDLNRLWSTLPRASKIDLKYPDPKQTNIIKALRDNKETYSLLRFQEHGIMFYCRGYLCKGDIYIDPNYITSILK